jgi:hypothetical protein
MTSSGGVHGRPLVWPAVRHPGPDRRAVGPHNVFWNTSKVC